MQDGQTHGRHPQGRTARIQGLLNCEGHQDANFLLEDTRARSLRPWWKGGGCDHGKNREASSFGGETELGDAESESSGEGVEMVTSEADDT